MRLRDLEPIMEDPQPNERGYQCFTFLCPTCRRLRVRHAIWAGEAGEVRWTGPGGEPCMERVWHATQGPARDWDSLTLAPSLDMPAHPLRDGQCAGWHGHIIDGVLR